MKVEITKTLLNELYESTLTIKEIAESLSETLGTKITPIKASELFNSQGYNMRTRKRGSSIEFVVINEEEAIPDAFQMTSRDEFALAETENEQYSI